MRSIARVSHSVEISRKACEENLSSNVPVDRFGLKLSCEMFANLAVLVKFE